MNRTVLAVQTSESRKVPPFRPRDFRRMVSLVWPFRRTLLIGVFLTIIFAGLHTISLAGVFPIFKTLLEKEGLLGWADRTVAGARLDLDLAPADGQGVVRVIRVHTKAADAAPDVQVGDGLAGATDQNVGALLRAVANAEAGVSLDVSVQRGEELIPVTLTPLEPKWKIRAIRTASGWVPADADTSGGKINILMFILSGVFVLVLIANGCRYYGEVFIAQSVLRGLMKLRFDLYQRTLRLPMSFFSGQSTADIVARFVQDMHN